MVPKVLCATFNHYWGNVTKTTRLVSRPISAEFTGERKGVYAKLLVVAERIEIIRSECDCCGDVRTQITKEDQTPHTLAIAIDKRINQIHLVDPMSLICPTCSTVLRPADIGAARSCWRCVPIKYPVRIPPPNPGMSEDFYSKKGEIEHDRDYVSLWTKP